MKKLGRNNYSITDERLQDKVWDGLTVYFF